MVFILPLERTVSISISPAIIFQICNIVFSLTVYLFCYDVRNLIEHLRSDLVLKKSYYYSYLIKKHIKLPSNSSETLFIVKQETMFSIEMRYQC